MTTPFFKPLILCCIFIFLIKNAHSQENSVWEPVLDRFVENLIDASSAFPTDEPLVAVLGILEEKDGQRADLSRRIETRLIGTLQNKTNYLVIEFEQIDVARQEWMEAFPDSSPEVLKTDLGELLGADWVIVGKYQGSDSQEIEMIELELFEVETGKVLFQKAYEPEEPLPSDPFLSNSTNTSPGPVVSSGPKDPSIKFMVNRIEAAERQSDAILQDEPPALSIFNESLADTEQTNPDTFETEQTNPDTFETEIPSEDEDNLEVVEDHEREPYSIPEGMVLIPRGIFEMGSVAGDLDEQPIHSVFVNDFLLDEHEVTNEEFSQCEHCAKHTGGFETIASNEPVVYVDWENAKRYCEFVNKRLPTEAEWEHAARAKTETEYSFGEDADDLERYAWYQGTREAMGTDRAQPVSTKEANPFGLYDMYGNVMEWTQDWYSPDAYQNALFSNPQGPPHPQQENYPLKVVRGGAWDGTFGQSEAKQLRSAARFSYATWTRSFLIGFRCASDIPEGVAISSGF